MSNQPFPLDRRWAWAMLALTALLLPPAVPSAVALPPAHEDPAALLDEGHLVERIPTADQVQAFQPLDNEHVMLSTGSETHYLLTLSRGCFGLRWARHIGVTASDNAIWAGFDALTADGEACPIRTIHRLDRPVPRPYEGDAL